MKRKFKQDRQDEQDEQDQFLGSWDSNILPILFILLKFLKS